MIKNIKNSNHNIILKIYKESELFQGLSKDSILNILENSVINNYESGRTLIQQGDKPTNIYFIIKGHIKTLRANTDGDETTIRMLSSGETCMEAVLFMGCPSPITVQTTHESSLLLIPGDFVKKFSLENPQFAANLLKIVTCHYKNALHQIDAISIKTPEQRVGYYFLQKHIENGSDNMEFELPFKKSTIANHLGITPETFSRTLGKIKKIGIEIDHEKIRLKDAYALCHFCDTDSAHNCKKCNRDGCPNGSLHD